MAYSLRLEIDAATIEDVEALLDFAKLSVRKRPVNQIAYGWANEVRYTLAKVPAVPLAVAEASCDVRTREDMIQE